MSDVQKYGFIDVETDGLWGRPFAIGAVVYDSNQNIINEYFARLEPWVVTDDFVKREVLPAMANEAATHFTYDDMISSFARWYKLANKNCIWINHLGYITEAFLFREMHRLNLIDTFGAPFPFIDVGTLLFARGHDPTSVETYAAAKRLPIATEITAVHHPIRDCVVTAAVFFDLMSQAKIKIEPEPEPTEPGGVFTVDDDFSSAATHINPININNDDDDEPEPRGPDEEVEIASKSATYSQQTAAPHARSKPKRVPDDDEEEGESPEEWDRRQKAGAVRITHFPVQTNDFDGMDVPGEPGGYEAQEPTGGYEAQEPTGGYEAQEPTQQQQKQYGSDDDIDDKIG